MAGVPFRHQIVEGIACFVGEGEGDFRTWLEAFTALRAHAAFAPAMPILFDYRAMISLPPPGEPERIARVFEPMRDHRMAIVVSDLVAFGIARQISSLSLHGHVRAFKAPDDALAWLHAAGV